MDLTKNQKHLIKQAQKEEIERRVSGFGGRIRIKKHGGYDTQTGLKNCSCCN